MNRLRNRHAVTIMDHRLMCLLDGVKLLRVLLSSGLCLALMASPTAAAHAQGRTMSDIPLPGGSPSASGAPSIGVATMEPDLTIVLRLRAVSPGALGEALLRYPPDHPQYGEIKAHLGGLMPGGSKPVPPFDP